MFLDMLRHHVLSRKSSSELPNSWRCVSIIKSDFIFCILELLGQSFVLLWPILQIGDLKGFFGLLMVNVQQLRTKLKILDNTYGNGTG
jgi:hypothetical protein